MKIKFNVTGSERKRLVNTIAEIVQAQPKYSGPPSFAYEVDFYTIDRNGTLIFDNRANINISQGEPSEIESLLECLVSRGFAFDESENAAQGEQSDNRGLAIEIPGECLNEAAFANLERLIKSRGSLIKKALGTNNLFVEKNGDKISFPWFAFDATADEVKAYAHFVSALCEMARAQKRVNISEKPAENEKYAFRCFLLRLGFIGKEYKETRKILLSKLSGNSAYRNKGTEVQDND